MPVVLETCGQTGKHCFRNKNVLNSLGNIFAFQEANFVSATMFPGVGNLGNIDRKQNYITFTSTVDLSNAGLVVKIVCSTSYIKG